MRVWGVQAIGDHVANDSSAVMAWNARDHKNSQI